MKKSGLVDGSPVLVPGSTMGPTCQELDLQFHNYQLKNVLSIVCGCCDVLCRVYSKSCSKKFIIDNVVFCLTKHGLTMSVNQH
jgi:hypothetical protein